ncbi:TPA: hypothetical protein HA246_06840 [Candidatus Woesearchaeota archaeon]|nr:hypothetical protein [Candidatus Woesearchaeota archaeon]
MDEQQTNKQPDQETAQQQGQKISQQPAQKVDQQPNQETNQQLNQQLQQQNNFLQTIEAIEKGSIVQRQRIEQLKKQKLEQIESVKAEYAKLDPTKQESREELNNKLLKLKQLVGDEQLLYKKLAEGARNTYITLLLKIKVLGFFDKNSKERLQESIDFVNLARMKFNEITSLLSQQLSLFNNLQEFNLKNFHDLHEHNILSFQQLTETAISFESKKNRLKDELIAKVARINAIYGDDIAPEAALAEVNRLLPEIKKEFTAILAVSYLLLLFKEIESINDYIERIYNAAKPEVRVLLDVNNKNSPLVVY